MRERDTFLLCQCPLLRALPDGRANAPSILPGHAFGLKEGGRDVRAPSNHTPMVTTDLVMTGVCRLLRGLTSTR
jgi:hypothetical protein